MTLIDHIIVGQDGTDYRNRQDALAFDAVLTIITTQIIIGKPMINAIIANMGEKSTKPTALSLSQSLPRKQRDLPNRPSWQSKPRAWWQLYLYRSRGAAASNDR